MAVVRFYTDKNYTRREKTPPNDYHNGITIVSTIVPKIVIQTNRSEDNMTQTIISTSMSKLLSCDCQHEFQDKMYGKGIRVHTKMKQSEKLANLWRCTICSMERNG